MQEIKLNYNKHIILIDSSYYVFYRYFATYKWYSLQKKEFNEKDFETAFLKHMESDINKITKKWKTEKNNLLFCMDCPRSKIWRNDIYKEYKITRQQNQNFNQNIFNVFHDYIVRKDLKSINIDRLEADDIVYLIHKKINNEKNKIIIITNDNDYLQLINDNTDVINMQFKNIKDRTKCTDGLSNLYYKALVGDKSDNIPKISNIFNKEKALQLSCLTKKDLESWLIENNIYDKFKFNLNLISFDYIPENHIIEFNNKYKF
jgi:DNA polymerase-1